MGGKENVLGCSWKILVLVLKDKITTVLPCSEAFVSECSARGSPCSSHSSHEGDRAIVSVLFSSKHLACSVITSAFVAAAIVLDTEQRDNHSIYIC